MHYYLIAPTAIVRNTEFAFTYHSEQALPIGAIVRINVGSKQHTGVVIEAVQKPAFATKPIIRMLGSRPIPAQLIDLATWMSDYYATHLAVVLQTMLPAGLHKNRRQKPSKETRPRRIRTKIILNHEQTSAVRSLMQTSGTAILHGVPGSGKTQVYIEAAKHVLSQGKSSIVLTPEIALTPQLVAEFQHHFPHIVITHSHMTEAQRHRAWLQVLEAVEPLIVIGPRSALFMPIARLGLIVIDEAHEPSYKQDQSPRYSALRTASVLARLHGEIPVVLGSATPAVSDYYLARHTTSSVISLSKPAIATEVPQLTLIDLRHKDSFREHRFFSDELLTAMREASHQRQQILLFHNRRGTAPTTLCSNCGWSALCAQCFIPITLHADQHKLLCHICGRAYRVPPSCPVCHNPSIVFRGIGTKLIETEVKKLFPKAATARFDADNPADQTVDSRYQDIYDGAIDILIGTQILAKGLDVPNLTVVGILQADNGLHLPDYQAEERVFQLLYQASGRVGRGKHSSRVVVQTFTPEHRAIQCALARDYQSFYQYQLKERRAGQFPPFVYLLKLTTSYKTEAGAIRAAQKMASEIRNHFPGVAVLGPTPSFYERLHGNYRWQLLVKSPKRAQLVAIASQMPAGWQVDLDAANLL